MTFLVAFVTCSIFPIKVFVLWLKRFWMFGEFFVGFFVVALVRFFGAVFGVVVFAVFMG